jgi:hypothetical protein
MDYFYDGQIRRYVTQFMRVFIGFKWQAGNGDQQTVPVMYGDMSRQVANIIKENSENKMPTVPRIACYIGSLEMDTTRLSDPTFVSKVHIRERRFTDAGGTREYQNSQGGNYTVERLMPTPFKLTMKADIWTSNTDQKLQLLEQILVLFNPSLELQTTDNYIDWTSLSTLYLTTTNFTSRTIPAGAESEIDILTLDFELPVWISPPAKVKKLGIVQSIIMNVFTEAGNIVDLDQLIYAGALPQATITTNNYTVLLFKSNTGNLTDNQYDLTIVNPTAAVIEMGLEKEYQNGNALEWMKILEVQGGYLPGSNIWFKKANGNEIRGTFVINPLDPTILSVSLDADTYPGNTDIVGVDTRGTIDAIIDPYKYNPLEVYGNYAGIPLGIRFLMLDDVSETTLNGAASWKNVDGSNNAISVNSIIEWNGTEWATVWDPLEAESDTYIQNIRTGIKYRWDGTQWLKAFEGEYRPGDWNFNLIG